MASRRGAALAFAALTLGVTTTAAAEQDAQLWLAAALRLRPEAPVRVTLQQDVRFDEDIQRLESVMPSVELRYDPVDFLRLAVGYRFEYARDGAGDLAVGHRLHLDASALGEFEWLELAYRIRYQERFEDDGGTQITHVLRNRLSFEVDTDTDFTPAVSSELFARLADGQAFDVRKVRVTAGVTYGDSGSDVELYYRVDVPIDRPNAPVAHIIGLGYRYTIRVEEEKGDGDHRGEDGAEGDAAGDGAEAEASEEAAGP